MKRIQGQLPFRILNGGRELACLFKQQDKLPENIGILLPKTFSLLLDPLVVQTRHEIAAVQGSRFFEFSPRSNRVACLSRLQAARRTLLKSRHIDYEFRRGMPQNVLTVRGDELPAIRKRGSQMMEQLSKVCSRLRLCGIGPKQERETLAGLKQAGMQSQIRK